jgi:prepilin-type N-terminal cleavage/methylation domain-containing protein
MAPQPQGVAARQGNEGIMEVTPALLFVRQRRQRGVTLFELIIVIFLFGVIGVVATSRILSANTFNELLVRDQIISLARVAQQSRLGRAPISLSLQPSADTRQLTVRATHGSEVLRSVTLNSADVSLRADINNTASCAATPGAASITSANPLTISYNALGSLGVSGVTGSTGAVSSAMRVCINSKAEMSVCISATGLAYAGKCDE